VNEDHWDADGNEKPLQWVDENDNHNNNMSKPAEVNAASTSTHTQHQVVDLSILETEDAAQKRSQSYRKSKKIYFDDVNDCWDDSSSDSSAKTHDSLRVHTCAFQKKHDHSKHHHHHSDKGLLHHRNGMDHHHHGMRDKNGNGKRPCSKVQTIVRLLERIGSGSSFNSSEGPSDSSKHNMKVWENAFRGQESKARKRSVGFNLKKLFKSFSNKHKNKKNKNSSRFHQTNGGTMLDRKVFDIRKLSL
jgi:hypothetical protein